RRATLRLGRCRPAGNGVFAKYARFLIANYIYHWNTPDVYAGWTFLLHFAVLTVLTYVMANWKPKGMKK
ncbi:MAG: hypothetical protein G8D58_14015, partial [gamma proteobacterium symbiont of Phacoides pectinatus]